MTAAALETLKTEMQQTAFITFMVMYHPEMGRLEMRAITHPETARWSLILMPECYLSVPKRTITEENPSNNVRGKSFFILRASI